MPKFPSEEERLKRISRNVEELPGRAVRNLKKSERGAEIIRHATSTASGVPRSRTDRPQDRIKVK